MPSNISGSDNFDTGTVSTRTLTLLADYSAERKYSGTITLSEPITNFEELIVESRYYTNDYNIFLTLPVDALTIGNTYRFWVNDSGHAVWLYTNSTTFTHVDEYYSWIYKLYGKGRIA